MCTMCDATATFVPERHIDESGAQIDMISEVSDAADDLSTDYAIGISESFSGELETAGDRDWIAITLEEGVEYTISQHGYWGGTGTLRDGYMRLYNDDGELVEQNDDGIHGYDSQITFTATESGTYYVSVGSYQDSYTGTYTLQLSADVEYDATEAVDVDVLADYLVTGYWHDTDRDERAFDTSESNIITVNLTGLTAEGQQLARWALDAWEMYADIQFVEETRNAQITFDDEDSGAYASTSTWGITTLEADINVSTSWIDNYGSSATSYVYLAYIHEVGHALGLGHLGDYNGSAQYGSSQTFANDSWQVSIMSYFSQNENTTVEASYGTPITPMIADIVAIQSIYGAPSEENDVTAGDSTWGHGSDFGNYLDDVFASFAEGADGEVVTSEAYVFTIYDSGGNDFLDLSTLSSDNGVNLNDGTYSDIRGRTGSLAIAEDTFIEDLRMGSGNDTVVGNELGNDIWGKDGDDSIDGGAGRDWIWGGVGSDTISGGEDRDIIFGNEDDDLLLGNDGNDLIVGQKGADILDGGSGNDVLKGGTEADIFIYNENSGVDRIHDFTFSHGDTLQLDAALVDAFDNLEDLYENIGSVDESGILLDFGDGDRLRLTNIYDWAEMSEHILIA